MYIVIFITAKDKEEANTIANKLLEDKLIACANIVESVKSLFWWDGKIDNANETLLILKTRKDLFEKIVTAVKTVHSYDVPEIIALPIVEGNKDYLEWIKEST